MRTSPPRPDDAAHAHGRNGRAGTIDAGRTGGGGHRGIGEDDDNGDDGHGEHLRTIWAQAISDVDIMLEDRRAAEPELGPPEDDNFVDNGDDYYGHLLFDEAELERLYLEELNALGIPSFFLFIHFIVFIFNHFSFFSPFSPFTSFSADDAESYDQQYLQALIDMHESVVCPLCGSGQLVTRNGGTCLGCSACALSLDLSPETISIESVGAQLQLCSDEHAATCAASPSFMIHQTPVLACLAMGCAVCHAFHIIV